MNHHNAPVVARRECFINRFDVEIIIHRIDNPHWAAKLDQLVGDDLDIAVEKLANVLLTKGQLCAHCGTTIGKGKSGRIYLKTILA